MSASLEEGLIELGHIQRDLDDWLTRVDNGNENDETQRILTLSSIKHQIYLNMCVEEEKIIEEEKLKSQHFFRNWFRNSVNFLKKWNRIGKPDYRAKFPPRESFGSMLKWGFISILGTVALLSICYVFSHPIGLVVQPGWENFWNVASGWPRLWHSFAVIYLGCLFGKPVINAIWNLVKDVLPKWLRSQYSFRQFKIKRGEEFRGQLEKLEMDRLFLLVQAKDCINHLVESYRSQLGTLQIKMKEAVERPSREAQHKIAGLNGEKDYIEDNFSIEELPDKEAIIMAIEGRIENHNRIIGLVTPKALEVAENFEFFDKQLSLVELGMEGLIYACQKYQRKEDVIARLSKQDMDDTVEIIQKRQELEFEMIQQKLRCLGGNIVATRVALNNFTILLPEATISREELVATIPRLLTARV